ncbi:hypothetical protein DICSQDRAFT_142953 [Dichomitus squalens LYAD-421 SS1]|uniref:uncharacterized protein n=1 Tax=Dichomitus squalens (strain LYAD-421) TaxID=732165 RepID=UPI0004413BAB|nr:uncharacterized protein DICSQDRAFT_142953 [Dichomitus squalens LYAD-421 SS1]EJF67417.1 hypothetical protein DICSQDRAFT_142953 [Dichomitus squalens LYAD-421 SS1]
MAWRFWTGCFLPKQRSSSRASSCSSITRYLAGRRHFIAPRSSGKNCWAVSSSRSNIYA